MANKTIQTRIRNKYDSLSAWQGSTSELLAGEIAIVAVPTATNYTNPVTGKEEPVVELLMKVGDGTKTFSQLPWLSAKASDVYEWAKEPTATNAKVSFIETKQDGSTVKHETTLSDVFGRLAVAEADIDSAAAVAGAASNKLTGITGTVTDAISTAITTALQELDFTPSTTDAVRPGVAGCFISKVTQADGKVTAEVKKLSLDDITFQITPDKVNTGNDTYAKLDAWIAHIDNAVSGILDSVTVNQTGTGVVKSVEKDDTTDGQINVTRALVGTADITDSAVTTGKINNGAVTDVKLADSAVKTAKIYNGAVTDAKVSAGIKAEKILVAGTVGGTGQNAPKYLDERLGQIDGAIGSLNSAVAGGVHFRGILCTLNAVDGRSLMGTDDFPDDSVVEPALEDGTVSEANTTYKVFSTTGAGADITYSEITVSAGDVIISDGTEFILVARQEDGGGVWYELGNADRISALEGMYDELYGAIDCMGYSSNKTDDDVNNSGRTFAVDITQEAGAVSVTWARPVADDVLYDETNTNKTVKSAIDALNGYINPTGWVSGQLDTVPELIDSKITAKVNTLSANTVNASQTKITANTAIVTGVSQTNGKITVTTQPLPAASTSAEGIVKLDATGGAVKYDTYELSEQAHAQFEGKVSPILGNYVHFDADTANGDTGKLRVGADTVDYIIFDCGGAN